MLSRHSRKYQRRNTNDAVERVAEKRAPHGGVLSSVAPDDIRPFVPSLPLTYTIMFGKKRYEHRREKDRKERMQLPHIRVREEGRQ